MPDSNTNTRLKNKNQNQIELPTSPPAALLTFRKPLIILAHIVAFAGSLMLSFLMAHEMQFKSTWLDLYPTLLLFFLLVKLPVFALFKQYRGWWRYVGVSDLLGILRASLISTLIIVALWFAMGYINPIRTKLPQDMREVAEGVCMADMFTTVLILGGLRMVIRLYHEEFRTIKGGRLRRFLIVGAGNAGEALLREIHRMPVTQYGHALSNPSAAKTRHSSMRRNQDSVPDGTGDYRYRIR